jgi:hypothetical protein
LCAGSRGEKRIGGRSFAISNGESLDIPKKNKVSYYLLWNKVYIEASAEQPTHGIDGQGNRFIP